MKKTKAFSTLLTLMLLISLFTAPSAYAVSDPPNNLSALVKSSTHPYFRADGTYVMPVYTNVSEIIKGGKYYVEYTNKDGTVDVYGPNEGFFQNDYGEWIMIGDGRPEPQADFSLKDDDQNINGFLIGKGTLLEATKEGYNKALPTDKVLKKYSGPGGKVVIPDGVQVIAPYVFADRKDITSVIIPDSVLDIEYNSFQNTSLTNIVIPKNVIEIKGRSFRDSQKLNYIIFAGKDTALCDGAMNCGNPKLVLYANNSHVEWYIHNIAGYTLKPLDQAPVAKGTLTLDTANYTTAPGKSYQIGVSLTGYGAHINAYSDNSNTVKLNKLPNGNYQVKGIRSGTAYIMFDVLNSSNKKISHASVKVTVKSGVKPYGDSHRQTLSF